MQDLMNPKNNSKKYNNSNKLYSDLKQVASASYKVYVMFIAGNCCSECDKIDGSVMSVEEALIKQRLPHSLCTGETGCICSYGMHGKRDLNAKLIMK
jgi:hypothetical protein